MDRRSRSDPFLLSLLSAALVLRLLGLRFGFPCQVFSDESHHINVALSFASGHLNPHIFKYPTLWMYVLFVADGLFFLVWSGLGLLHSPADFLTLFVWKPYLFYWVARLVTALAGTATVYFLYRAALLQYQTRWAAVITGALAASSSFLVFYSHVAKPDILMMMWVAAALYFFVKHQQYRNDRNFYFGCALFGLACSTQYTAAFAVPFLFFPGLMSKANDKSFKSRLKKTFAGLALVGVFFFLGSPFALFDWRTFLADFLSLRAYGAGALTANGGRVGFRAVHHFMEALGPAKFGGAILLASLAQTLFRFKRRSLILLGPLLWGGIFLALQNAQAGAENYTFSVLPFLFLMTGGLGSELVKIRKPAAVVIALAMVIPSFVQGAGVTADLRKEDTRPQATAWINANLPAGSKILLDQPHTGPFLVPSKDQVERLLEQTKSKGNPRAKLFEAMAKNHPGGGYEIVRLERTWKELISPLERQTEGAHEASEWVDAEDGVEAVRRAGVDYIVWSDRGATRVNSPRLKKYFDDLDQTPVLKEFDPTSSISPVIKIYAVNSAPSNANR